MVYPAAARQREVPYHNESQVASSMRHRTASDFTGCCGQFVSTTQLAPSLKSFPPLQFCLQNETFSLALFYALTQS